MKSTIVSFLIILSIAAGCSKDSSANNNTFQLPPEPQVGANTFGVTIKGKVYVPRTPTGYQGDLGATPYGMRLWLASDFSWYELEAKDGHSAIGFNMRIHLVHVTSVGHRILQQSNFLDSYDSLPSDNIFFSIWDPAISNYAFYGSIENEGEVNITHCSNGILSANFKGKFVRYNNPDDVIEITDGRFDIGPNLTNTYFP